MTQQKRTVTVIPGDGIGPEVVRAAQRVIDATGVGLQWDEREAGRQSFQRGITTGVPDDTLRSIRATRLVLKGPLETVVGSGGKSANVTLRKLFETYANIRPAPSQCTNTDSTFHRAGTMTTLGAGYRADRVALW